MLVQGLSFSMWLLDVSPMFSLSEQNLYKTNSPYGVVVTVVEMMHLHSFNLLSTVWGAGDMLGDTLRIWFLPTQTLQSYPRGFISFLLPCNKSLQNLEAWDSIHCDTALSVCRESRHGLADTSAQGPRSLQSRWTPSCVLIWMLDWGKTASKLISFVGRVHFLTMIRLWALVLAGYQLDSAYGS